MNRRHVLAAPTSIRAWTWSAAALVAACSATPLPADPSSPVEQCTSLPGVAQVLAWAPDSSFVAAITAQSDGANQVWVLPAAGDGARQLAASFDVDYGNLTVDDAGRVYWLETTGSAARLVRFDGEATTYARLPDAQIVNSYWTPAAMQVLSWAAPETSNATEPWALRPMRVVDGVATFGAPSVESSSLRDAWVAPDGETAILVLRADVDAPSELVVRRGAEELSAGKHAYVGAPSLLGAEVVFSRSSDMAVVAISPSGTERIVDTGPTYLAAAAPAGMLATAAGGAAGPATLCIRDAGP